MPEYDPTDRGALFKNDRKQTEKHPDYTGNLNVNGTDYWISAWIKTSKKGTTFMSLSVTEKDTNQKKAEPRSVPGIDRPDYPHEPQGYDGPPADSYDGPEDYESRIPF